jgi:Trk K+ transport system NAD-binding subunit
MNTTQLYDIIVIGASQEGITFCENLISKTENVKVALVSKNFNHLTAKNNLLGVNLMNVSTTWQKVYFLLE